MELKMEDFGINVADFIAGTARARSVAKATLTREIKAYQKEIDWITRNDHNGKPISKWYLGELRAPQLGTLKSELFQLRNFREHLEVLDYPDKLGKLMISKMNVSSHFVYQLLQQYAGAINSCALNNVSLTDAMVAIYKLSN